jgi:hypothetical protein
MLTASSVSVKTLLTAPGSSFRRCCIEGVSRLPISSPQYHPHANEENENRREDGEPRALDRCNRASNTPDPDENRARRRQLIHICATAPGIHKPILCIQQAGTDNEWVFEFTRAAERVRISDGSLRGSSDYCSEPYRPIPTAISNRTSTTGV